MTHIKRIILFPLALIFFYLGLLAAVQLLIKSKLPEVEQLVKNELDVKSVSINRYINLPFFFVTFRDLDVDLDDFSTIHVDKIRLQYSLLALLFKGPESMIPKIKVSTVKINGSLGSLTRLIPEPSTNTNAIRNNWIYRVNTRLKLDKLVSDIKVIGQIGGELQVSDLSIKWRNKQLWIKSNVFFNLGKGDYISYARSAMYLDININDLQKQLARGELQVLGFNLAGVDLVENAALPFSINKEIILDLDHSSLRSFLSQTNGEIHFYTKKIFTLLYHRYDELHILEHMFDPGTYQGSLDLVIRDEGVSLYTSVASTNNDKNQMEIRLSPRGDVYFLTGMVDSQKYGLARIDLRFEPGNAFPSGTIITRDIEMIPGLAVNTRATVIAEANTLLVRGQDLYMNGGRIGSTGARLVLESDGRVTFRKVPWYVNALVDGEIGKIDYVLNIGLNNIPGSAIVNNIGFDMFNLGRGYYQGKMKIFNDGPHFKITADMFSVYQGKRSIDVNLDLTDETLALPLLRFRDSDLTTSLVLDFTHPYKDRTQIKLSGSASLGKKIRFPLKGEVLTYPEEKKTLVQLSFDNAIALNIYSANNNSQISINTSNYPMKTFGLPGILDGDIAIKLRNSSLNELGVNLQYHYEKRDYQLKLQTGKLAKGILPVTKFILAMDSDKIYGNGKLWETKNRLNTKIDFVRGGALKFESSFEKINGLLSIKNLFIKDLLAEHRDVFFSMDMNFSGPLSFPDFQIHKLSMINSVDSSPFSLSATGISRRPGLVNIANLYLRSPDFSTRLSGKLRFKPEGLDIEGSGVLGYGGIIKTGFDVNIQQEGKADIVNYELYDISLGKESIDPFQGRVIRENKIYSFSSADPANGISGSFSDHTKKSWDITAQLSRLKAESSGTIIGKEFSDNSRIKLSADLKLLSFMDDVFKKIGGQLDSQLRIQGTLRDPRFSGNFNIKKGQLSIVNLDMNINDFNGNIPIQDSKMLFKSFKIPTSTGLFLFDGYIEMSQFLVSYIDLTLQPFPGGEAWLALGVQTPFIKILGNLYIKQVRMVGPPMHLRLSGDATARNANIFVGLSGDAPGAEEGLLEGIVWNLNVNLGNGVKFGNQFIDTTLSAGQTLQVLGSIGDGSLSLKGDVGVTRGVLTFLQQDFTITEGSASFSGQLGDPIPYVNIETKTYTRDPEGGRIEVILTFEGKLTKISLKDYYAKNSTIGQNELSALLGFQPLGTGSSGTNQSVGAVQNVAVGGWNALENTFIFNPIANTLRRTLGLDLVLIRSQALGNIFESTIFGSSTNIDAISIIEGTSLTFGKYLFSNLFVEYELSFERNDLSTLGLEPMHSFGIGLDWQNFFLGWKYGPEDLGTGGRLNYEHSLDFQFHQKF